MSNVERYDPTPDLRALGEPLIGSEMPEILFRFPGPCGLFDLSHGVMHRLAPPELSYAYFGSLEHLEFSDGIRSFGSLAVFFPEKFHVVRLVDDEVLSALGFTGAHRGNVYLGVNRPVEAGDYAWVPPDVYFGTPSLCSCRSLDEVVSLVGSAYHERQEEMFRSVRSYMEEMGEILRRDIPRPPGSWYAVPPEDRRRILAEHNLEPRWI